MSRRRRRSWRLGLVVLGVLLAPAVALAQTCTMPPKPSGLVAASVVRVIDGDTIVVRLPDGRITRVRMIGIDAPEVRPNEKLWRDAERSHRDAAAIQAEGTRASKFTKKHLAGRRIDIERDVTAVDRYGRTLAYVWLGEELYNILIVREGYASLMTVPPNVKYASTLAACHRVAVESRRGLWAARE